MLSGRETTVATPARGGRLSPLSGRSILCVLPDETLARVARHALQPALLTVVGTGREALTSINRSAFDAYVLDFWLPDWSGLSLCRDIRKTDQHVPICFFTNARHSDALKKSMRAGADLYLAAATETDSLRNRMESLLLVREAGIARARAEEERAIEEELARRARELCNMAREARDRVAHVIERTTRTRASLVFLEAGGTRARFEQTWPEAYAALVSKTGAE